jgi:VWFA-related protein
MIFYRSGRARPSSFLALFALCGVLVAQSPSAIPQATAPAEKVPVIKATTRVVLLDVVVTDNKGQPVTDLKKEDVTILEGGKKQALASFNLVDRRTAAKQAVPEMLPDVYYNRVGAGTTSDPVTVMLLDTLNTPVLEQSYMRDQMLKYLKEQHQPGQRMAIYGLANSLILLQDFTDDPELLRKAIEKRKPAPSPLLAQAPIENPELEDKLAAALDRFDEQQTAFQNDVRVKITLDALKAIAASLNGYPGRKKLLWISAAFPSYMNGGEQTGSDTQRSYGNDIVKTTTLLSDAQFSIYPIDAMALAPNATFSAQKSGRGTNGHLTSGPQFNTALAKAAMEGTAAHETMRQVADETGGKAFYNRNDLDTAVEESIADGNTYYAISYSPEDKNWDGKFRKIKLEVNRSGTQLRYRHGYYALDPMRPAVEDRKVVERELAFGLESPLLASGVAFFGNVKTVPPSADPAAKPASPNRRTAEVRFLVDASTASFDVLEGNIQHCSLEFVIGTFVGNKMIAHEGHTLAGNFKPETFAAMMKQGILFRDHIDIPDGNVRLRLLVRDGRNGHIGTVDVPYPTEIAKKAN